MSKSLLMSPLAWISKLAVVATLAVPAAVALLPSSGPNAENRNLAILPARPASRADWLALPASLTVWVDDHFGFRTKMVRLYSQARFKVFGEFPSIQMIKGQHGRYFLAAHGTNVPPFQAMTHVCGQMSVANPGTIPYMNRMFAGFHRMGLHPRLLVVPSAPVVYAQDVPAWMMPACSAPQTPVSAVLASPLLTAEARAATFFPLAQMRTIAQSASLWPNTWFHWSGAGLDQVARLSLTEFWQRPLDQAPVLKTLSVTEKSDVSHLFPGIKLASTFVRPDPAASGIQGCEGITCYPEIPDVAKVLDDVSRYDNPAAPPRRLLILSDSFGSKISPWYSRYYRHVEQMATNGIARLTPEQMEQLRRFAFRDMDNTDFLILYHDGGAMYDILEMGMHRFHETPAAPPVAAGAP